MGTPDLFLSRIRIKNPWSMKYIFPEVLYGVMLTYMHNLIFLICTLDILIPGHVCQTSILALLNNNTKPS